MTEQTVPVAAIADGGKSKGVAITVLATMALACNNVLIPMAYARGATPTATLLVRYVVLIAGLAAVLLLLRKPLRLAPRYLPHAVAAGCLSCAGSFGLITSFGLIPVSLSLLILYLYPMITAILQSIIERSPVSLGQFACLLAAFGGLAIALGAGGTGMVEGFNLAGGLSALAAAFGFSGFFLWSRYGLKGAEPGATTLHTSIAGLLLAAVFGIVLQAVGAGSFAVPAAGDSFGWLALVALSMFFSLAYFGMSWGIQLIGPTPATMLMNLETVFTLPLAALALGETLDARRLTGAGVVLGSVVMSQLLASRRTR